MPSTRKQKANARKEAVLRSFSALSADHREWVRRQQQLEAETIALRARLPDFLQPFASNLSVCDPSDDQKIRRLDGANSCTFYISASSVSLTVSPPASTHPQKHLKIHSENWGTSSRYVTDCASSEKLAVFLSYRAVDDESDRRGLANADPGEDMYAHSAKGVKEIVEDVVRDMGYTMEKLDKDACMMFWTRSWKHASLRQVIRDDLELKEGDPEGVILGTVIGP
ncbi:hypothetical protein CPB85DRAFT_1439288 [Mucidula mucida]|nr:hypothetical protein CPB85DRAFT_1439288 [Mucidula mucida]